MMNPLEYFEDLLSSDKTGQKKQHMISNNLENWNFGIVDTNTEKGIIKYSFDDYDEETKVWENVTSIFTFEDYFEQEIERNTKDTIKSLSKIILDIISKGISSEIFIRDVKNKIKNLKTKSGKYYSTYPFVMDSLITIEDYISEYLSSAKTPIFKQTSIATPVPILNYSPLSFKWDLINPEDIIERLSRLFDLLTESPSLIDGAIEDFINGFSQREVVSGISWLVLSKNKTCSKASLIYLLQQLMDRSDLMDEPNDFNKKVEYVFRDNIGMKLNNIKQSKSQQSDNPTQKERIDEIIDRLLD